LFVRSVGSVFFNFIHFLSAKFNLFDARRNFSSQKPREAVDEEQHRQQRTKKGHEKKKEKLGILIMHINYVSQQFFAFFSFLSSSLHRVGSLKRSLEMSRKRQSQKGEREIRVIEYASGS
jgi:ABC-type uncharacterized transport system fused permease/ATPase subunit